MICYSCKEDINPKSKYAISQNVCPFCGNDILSKSDFLFRKSIISILRKNGLNSDETINNIISDIENLVNGSESEKEKEKGKGKEMLTETETKFLDVKNDKNPDSITLEDIGELNDNTPISSDEEKEVKEMLENGEVIFTNPVISKTRTISPKGKPVPRSISRI